MARVPARADCVAEPVCGAQAFAHQWPSLAFRSAPDVATAMAHRFLNGMEIR